jgi:serine/threonine-protein kinase RsbW
VDSRIELKIPSKMEYLGIPDAILMEIGSDMDCCRRAMEELGTSVIEACTNAMEHGNRLDESTPIEVIFELDDHKVTVTVLDHGPGFDFGTWKPSEELMRQRGRGILIMKEFCDILEYGHHEDGRFLVRLIKQLDPTADDD